jgi:hypothetical protein
VLCSAIVINKDIQAVVAPLRDVVRIMRRYDSGHSEHGKGSTSEVAVLSIKITVMTEVYNCPMLNILCHKGLQI